MQESSVLGAALTLNRLTRQTGTRRSRVTAVGGTSVPGVQLSKAGHSPCISKEIFVQSWGTVIRNFGDVQSMLFPTTKDTVAERMKLLLCFCRERMLKVEVAVWGEVTACFTVQNERWRGWDRQWKAQKMKMLFVWWNIQGGQKDAKDDREDSWCGQSDRDIKSSFQKYCKWMWAGTELHLSNPRKKLHIVLIKRKGVWSPERAFPVWSDKKSYIWICYVESTSRIYT